MLQALHLQELLHNAAQALLYPTIALLIVLMVYALVSMVGLVVEGVLERRHFKVALPALLKSIHESEWTELPALIEGSGLLKQQRSSVCTLVESVGLPPESRVALAKRLLAQQEEAYSKVASRTDLVAKVAPMIGQMGPLVPLGPRKVAKGQGQTDDKASSIEVAFDTTVAGLVVAIVALFITRFRKRWYNDYMEALEPIYTAILEKADAAVCEDLTPLADAPEPTPAAEEGSL